MRKSAVVALGGNAFTLAGQKGTYPEQMTNALAMAESINQLIKDGWQVAVVHGNGPQVGSLAIQQEEGADLVPAQPLFTLGAMTEASLGSLIELALRKVSGGKIDAIAIVTHTVVEPDDPAFTNPTKPIGPFFAESQVAELERTRGWTMKEDAGRGWRRVVPSPRPVAIVEAGAIKRLMRKGTVVIAAGGGGIPVIESASGYEGVDAVVDKDFSAEQLASQIGADTLILVTGVAQVALDFGTVDERTVDLMTRDDAAAWLAQGQFPPGSMGPKIQAAIDFVDRGGRKAVITSPDLVASAAAAHTPGERRLGTTIVWSEEQTKIPV